MAASPCGNHLAREGRLARASALLLMLSRHLFARSEFVNAVALFRVFRAVRKGQYCCAGLSSGEYAACLLAYFGSGIAVMGHCPKHDEANAEQTEQAKIQEPLHPCAPAARGVASSAAAATAEAEASGACPSPRARADRTRRFGHRQGLGERGGRNQQQQGGARGDRLSSALVCVARRFLQETGNRAQLARWDTIGTLTADRLDIIALFSFWHCYGGAPRGERPASWDARRLARRLACGVISALTRVFDA
jgi:hypothetical protein